MPAAPDILTPDDRWDLVHYVLSLSEVHHGVGLDSMRMRMGDDDTGHAAGETHHSDH
jgi:mono/diheme cytochrome c family protein